MLYKFFINNIIFIFQDKTKCFFNKIYKIQLYLLNKFKEWKSFFYYCLKKKSQITLNPKYALKSIKF